jgi:hypothetical protein
MQVHIKFFFIVEKQESDLKLALFLMSIIFPFDIFFASYNGNRKKDFTKGRNVLDAFTERLLRSSTNH